jgi:hypothetical protein
MSFKIGIVTTTASQHLRGGLTKPRTQLVELLELDLGSAVADPSLLAEAHALVFAIGDDVELCDVDRVTGPLRTLHERDVPRVLLGGHRGYTRAGSPEGHHESLAPDFWPAVHQILEIFASHAYPRVVIIDDVIEDIEGVPMPGAKLAGEWTWIVPLCYEVPFERRNFDREREVRRAMRALCATPKKASATRVVMDIQLGTDHEGAALATELLFSDSTTELFPVSGHGRQSNFDRAAGLLANTFAERLHRSTAKRQTEPWLDHLAAVLSGELALAREIAIGAEHHKVRPANAKLALRASLLTLLGPEFPYRLERALPAHLGFLRLHDPDASLEIAAREARSLARDLVADSSTARFMSSWSPNDLVPIPSRSSGEVAALLPDGRRVPIPNGMESLREVMCKALTGVTEENDWTPNLDGLKSWVNELLEVYARKAVGGPFSSVLDKFHDGGFVHAWNDDAKALRDVSVDVAAVKSVSRGIARQFMGLGSPSEYAAIGVGLLVVATLEYARAWSTAGKRGTMEGQSTERFSKVISGLPMAPDSIWGRRRGVPARTALDAAGFNALVRSARAVGHQSGAPWPGPEPFEILVQLTLPLL